MRGRPDQVPPAELSDNASATEIAAYVAALTGELAVMARGSGLPTLAYLLDMARIEASERAHMPERVPELSVPGAP